MYRYALGITLIVSVPAFAADSKPWDGHYKPVSITFDDQDQLPDPDAKSRMTLVVKDGEYRMFWQKDKGSKLHLRLFTADVTLDKDGKSFSLSIKDGSKKGQQLHGIYVTSKTQLHLCYGPADKPRPIALAGTKGTGHFYEVWEREKK